MRLNYCVFGTTADGARGWMFGDLLCKSGITFWREEPRGPEMELRDRQIRAVRNLVDARGGPDAEAAGIALAGLIVDAVLGVKA